MAKENRRGGEGEEEDVREERAAGWEWGGVNVWVKGCGKGPLRGIRAGPGVSHYIIGGRNDRA